MKQDNESEWKFSAIDALSIVSWTNVIDSCGWLDEQCANTLSSTADVAIRQVGPDYDGKHILKSSITQYRRAFRSFSRVLQQG